VPVTCLASGRLLSLSFPSTSNEAPLFPDEQFAPGLGVHTLLNPMYPHAANNLLFPRNAGNGIAFAARNCPGFVVSMNDAVEEYAIVVTIHGEVVPFSKDA